MYLSRLFRGCWISPGYSVSHLYNALKYQLVCRQKYCLQLGGRVKVTTGTSLLTFPGTGEAKILPSPVYHFILSTEGESDLVTLCFPQPSWVSQCLPPSLQINDHVPHSAGMVHGGSWKNSTILWIFIVETKTLSEISHHLNSMLFSLPFLGNWILYRTSSFSTQKIRQLKF